MSYHGLILFHDNARLSFLKMGFNFLTYTVFTSLASFLTQYIYYFLFKHCIDIHFLVLALANVYYVYSFFIIVFVFLRVPQVL